MNTLGVALLLLLLGALCPESKAAEPNLVPGVWTKITPADVTVTLENHVLCHGLALDPVHPSTMYLCVAAFDVSKGGLYKTTDGGGTWARIGQLDEPFHLVVNPKDPKQLYCVDGVRGKTIGFWVSSDGGETWTIPAGFKAVTSQPNVGVSDVYSVDVDPTDFKHVLVSFHSPWIHSKNCGVLESKNGGDDWIVHNPPAGSAGGYGMSVFFLYDPATKQGDPNTWLFTAQQGGFFRTTDAGATWSLVYKLQMTHGGDQLYRAKDGTLYAGAYQYPVRSTDNGATWTPIKKGVPYGWYMGICGDGVNLFTASSNQNRPFYTSSEKDGLTWTAYGAGRQTFSSEPFEMRYDPIHHIMYASSWGEGLLALKLEPSNDK